MPAWKREVRRRVDDMLLMLRESRQVFGLRLEGEALDPADARRVWRTDKGPDGTLVRPLWASDLVLLHACRFKGTSPWFVLETLKVWNGLLWWPGDLLGELLDLLETKAFMAGQGGNQIWVYQKFKDLQARLSQHINSRGVDISDSFVRKVAAHQSKVNQWARPDGQDGVVLVTKRML